MKFNSAFRIPKLVDVFCTVTTASGETSSVKATVAKNNINKLNGNCLTAQNLYELVKKGKTETKDLYGNTFVYEVKPVATRSATVEVAEQSEKVE